MSKKNIYLLSLLFLICIFFVGKNANAQRDVRCWTEKGCEDVQGVFFQGPETVTCGNPKNAVGTKIGFCLPVGTIDTKIALSGTTRFANLGEYFKFLYKYGIQIAGIFAVLFLIIGGFQWMMSGGNTDAIGSAKNRIKNAIIGLLILLLSFMILDTINPYLTSFRLPQVYMINRVGLLEPSCAVLDDGERIAQANNKPGQAIDEKKLSTALWNLKGLVRPKCGLDYFVEGAGLQTCTGHVCERSDDTPGTAKTCYTRLDKSKISCNVGNIAGIISHSDEIRKGLISGDQTLVNLGLTLATEGWTWPWAEDVELHVICKDGENYEITTHDAHPIDFDKPSLDSAYYNKKKMEQEFTLQVKDEDLDNAPKKCSSRGGVKGFVIAPDLNEQASDAERHYIGIDRQTGFGKDLGDYWHSDDEEILKSAPMQYFFTAEEIKEGFPLNIDMNRIYDIDDDDDRKSYYYDLGYE